MRNTSLERILSRVPELVELTAHIPGVTARLHRAFGGDTEPRWQAEDPAFMTLVFYVAGLVEQLEELAGRITRLEEERAAIESKAETVRAADLHWRAVASTRDGVVFSNGPGDTVTLPRDFLAVIRSKRQLDVSEIVEDGRDIVVRDGDQVVTRVPKTLWVGLGKVLEGCPWVPGPA